MSSSKKNPIEIDLSASGSNLYFFFGGIAAGMAMPPFEFYKSSKILDENKIFIRDLSQCWYHNGILGISKDIDSTAKFLQEQIDKIKPNKIFTVGNSMGGYAAILFATLIGKGEVIAFAPQTFISPPLRLKHRDFRWIKQILNTYRKSLVKRKIWDLRPPLLSSDRSPKVTIFVSKESQLDCIHASHIADIPGIHVNKCEGSEHGVVKLLRDEGKLPAIMLGTYL